MGSSINESYISRCQKALKAIGAPLSGWYCDQVIDVDDAAFDFLDPPEKVINPD